MIDNKLKLCDYDTCKALTELGYERRTMLFKGNKVIQAPTLFDAQVWIYDTFGDWVKIPETDKPLEMLQLCVYTYLRKKITNIK